MQPVQYSLYKHMKGPQSALLQTSGTWRVIVTTAPFGAYISACHRYSHLPVVQHGHGCQGCQRPVSSPTTWHMGWAVIAAGHLFFISGFGTHAQSGVFVSVQGSHMHCALQPMDIKLLGTHHKRISSNGAICANGNSRQQKLASRSLKGTKS